MSSLLFPRSATWYSLRWIVPWNTKGAAFHLNGFETMLSSYIPVLVMVAGATVVALALIGLSALLGPRRPSASKDSAYECGVTPIGSARERFPVKFYLTAMLFIVFDIETIFLYPWAVNYKASGGLMLFNLVEMLVFVAILLVGYIYVWKRGGLEWG